MADKDKKVDSPRWQALNALYHDVKNNLSTVSDALKDADKKMAGGKGDVWIGPTARKWGKELSGHSGGLSKKAHEFLTYVHKELQATEKKVTPEKAQAERWALDRAAPVGGRY